jgi:hypothetical protein
MAFHRTLAEDTPLERNPLCSARPDGPGPSVAH